MKNQSTAPVDSQSKGTPSWHGKKGKKADLIGVHTEEPLCNEIFLHDACAPHTNEAYTTVHLPASASNKEVASLWVTGDTGTSGNILPLHLFRHLYPNCIDKTQLALMQATLGSLPTMVPRYPLHITSWAYHLAAWFPKCRTLPDKLLLVCGRNPWFCHPGVGLPPCERLEFVKMNCAVKVIQDTTHLPGPTPVPPTAKKTAPIKSTKDFIRMFPDRFQGIGQFHDEYTIRLHDDAKTCHTCPPRNVQFPHILSLGQKWTRW